MRNEAGGGSVDLSSGEIPDRETALGREQPFCLGISESYEDCLIRECREECGLEVEPLECYEEMEYTYPDGTIRFRFFLSRWKGGELSRNVHEELCWAAAETFSAYEFCPANRDLVRRMAEEFGHPVQESLYHSSARPF